MNQSTPLDFSNMKSSDYERLISAATLMLDFLLETMPNTDENESTTDDTNSADTNVQKFGLDEWSTSY